MSILSQDMGGAEAENPPAPHLMGPSPVGGGADQVADFWQSAPYRARVRAVYIFNFRSSIGSCNL